MIKFLVIGVLAAGAGAAGYFGEKVFRPTPAPAPEVTQPAKEKPQHLYQLPLGKFTMQILGPTEVLHLVIDIEVFVMGAGPYQKINGAVGKAKLRDATVAAIAELAETDFTLLEPMEDEARKRRLAAQIVRKLYVEYPMVRTARIKSYKANLTLRN